MKRYTSVILSVIFATYTFATSEIQTKAATTSATQATENYQVPYGFDTKKPNVKYGTASEVSYYSKTTWTNRKCFVILPADYSPEKKYPVLYLLHGIGGTNTEWFGGNPVEVIGNLTAEGNASEMIVVMPNVRAAADDSVPQEILGQKNISAFDNFINDLSNDLMPFINSKYPVKQDRESTAIAGLSMGGRESLFIGFKKIDKFAYIGAFSPAPGLIPDSSLNYPGQFTKAQFTIPSNSIYKPKVIMICSGNNDSTVGNTPYTYHQTLVDNNVNHLWYITDGGHDFTVWKHGLYNFVKRIFKSDNVSNVKLGDVNNDGQVNALDYAMLKSHLLGNTVNINLKNADMNNDGKINSLDLAAVKKILLS